VVHAGSMGHEALEQVILQKKTKSMDKIDLGKRSITREFVKRVTKTVAVFLYSRAVALYCPLFD